MRVGNKNMLIAPIMDNDLVLRLQTNDVKAFDALYWKYHEPLYANIYKLTKEVDATKDILQEVFITLWEKRACIDPNQPVANWLFTISYNKSVNYLKKVLKEQLFFKEVGTNTDGTDEQEINLLQNNLELLEKAMNHLSPQQRKVFELCKLKNKTYQEAASVLNISRHTVKEYLSVAMCNIKEFIKK